MGDTEEECEIIIWQVPMADLIFLLDIFLLNYH